MPNRQEINILNADSSTSNTVTNDVEGDIINDYKKLNDKCDTVITKIKNRKSKVKKGNSNG